MTLMNGRGGVDACVRSISQQCAARRAPNEIVDDTKMMCCTICLLLFAVFVNPLGAAEVRSASLASFGTGTRFIDTNFEDVSGTRDPDVDWVLIPNSGPLPLPGIEDADMSGNRALHFPTRLERSDALAVVRGVANSPHELNVYRPVHGGALSYSGTVTLTTEENGAFHVAARYDIRDAHGSEWDEFATGSIAVLGAHLRKYGIDCSLKLQQFQDAVRPICRSDVYALVEDDVGPPLVIKPLVPYDYEVIDDVESGRLTFAVHAAANSQKSLSGDGGAHLLHGRHAIFRNLDSRNGFSIEAVVSGIKIEYSSPWRVNIFHAKMSPDFESPETLYDLEFYINYIGSAQYVADVCLRIGVQTEYRTQPSHIEVCDYGVEFSNAGSTHTVLLGARIARTGADKHNIQVGHNGVWSVGMQATLDGSTGGPALYVYGTNATDQHISVKLGDGPHTSEYRGASIDEVYIFDDVLPDNQFACHFSNVGVVLPLFDKENCGAIPTMLKPLLGWSFDQVNAASADLGGATEAAPSHLTSDRPGARVTHPGGFSENKYLGGGANGAGGALWQRGTDDAIGTYIEATRVRLHEPVNGLGSSAFTIEAMVLADAGNGASTHSPMHLATFGNAGSDQFHMVLYPGPRAVPARRRGTVSDAVGPLNNFGGETFRIFSNAFRVHDGQVGTPFNTTSSAFNSMDFSPTLRSDPPQLFFMLGTPTWAHQLQIDLVFNSGANGMKARRFRVYASMEQSYNGPVDLNANQSEHGAAIGDAKMWVPLTVQGAKSAQCTVFDVETHWVQCTEGAAVPDVYRVLFDEWPDVYRVRALKLEFAYMSQDNAVIMPTMDLGDSLGFLSNGAGPYDQHCWHPMVQNRPNCNLGFTLDEVEVVADPLQIDALIIQLDAWSTVAEIPAIGDGAWHHVVLTYEAVGGEATYTVYFDGEEVQSETGPAVSSLVMERIDLMSDDTGERPWLGALDEFIVYEEALTACRARVHYENMLETRRHAETTFGEREPASHVCGETAAPTALVHLAFDENLNAQRSRTIRGAPNARMQVDAYLEGGCIIGSGPRMLIGTGTLWTGDTPVTEEGMHTDMARCAHRAEGTWVSYSVLNGQHRAALHDRFRSRGNFDVRNFFQNDNFADTSVSAGVSVLSGTGVMVVNTTAALNELAVDDVNVEMFARLTKNDPLQEVIFRWNMAHNEHCAGLDVTAGLYFCGDYPGCPFFKKKKRETQSINWSFLHSGVNQRVPPRRIMTLSNTASSGWPQSLNVREAVLEQHEYTLHSLPLDRERSQQSQAGFYDLIVLSFKREYEGVGLCQLLLSDLEILEARSNVHAIGFSEDERAPMQTPMPSSAHESGFGRAMRVRVEAHSGAPLWNDGAHRDWARYAQPLFEERFILSDGIDANVFETNPAGLLNADEGSMAQLHAGDYLTLTNASLLVTQPALDLSGSNVGNDWAVSLRFRLDNTYPNTLDNVRLYFFSDCRVYDEGPLSELFGAPPIDSGGLEVKLGAISFGDDPFDWDSIDVRSYVSGVDSYDQVVRQGHTRGAYRRNRLSGLYSPGSDGSRAFAEQISNSAFASAQIGTDPKLGNDEARWSRVTVVKDGSLLSVTYGLDEQFPPGTAVGVVSNVWAAWSSGFEFAVEMSFRSLWSPVGDGETGTLFAAYSPVLGNEEVLDEIVALKLMNADELHFIHHGRANASVDFPQSVVCTLDGLDGRPFHANLFDGRIVHVGAYAHNTQATEGPNVKLCVHVNGEVCACIFMGLADIGPIRGDSLDFTVGNNVDLSEPFAAHIDNLLVTDEHMSETEVQCSFQTHYRNALLNRPMRTERQLKCGYGDDRFSARVEYTFNASTTTQHRQEGMFRELATRDSSSALWLDMRHGAYRAPASIAGSGVLSTISAPMAWLGFGPLLPRYQYTHFSNQYVKSTQEQFEARNMTFDANAPPIDGNLATLFEVNAISVEAMFRLEPFAEDPDGSEVYTIFSHGSRHRQLSVSIVQCSPGASGVSCHLTATAPTPGGTWRYTSLAAVVEDDEEWHHVAFLYDGANGQATLLLDGSQYAFGTPDLDYDLGVVFIDLNALTLQLEGGGAIGNVPWGGERFEGQVDEVAVYAGAMPVCQAAQHAERALMAARGDAPMRYLALRERDEQLLSSVQVCSGADIDKELEPSHWWTFDTASYSSGIVRDNAWKRAKWIRDLRALAAEGISSMNPDVFASNDGAIHMPTAPRLDRIDVYVDDMSGGAMKPRAEYLYRDAYLLGGARLGPGGAGRASLVPGECPCDDELCCPTVARAGGLHGINSGYAVEKTFFVDGAALGESGEGRWCLASPRALTESEANGYRRKRNVDNVRALEWASAARYSPVKPSTSQKRSRKRTGISYPTEAARTISADTFYASSRRTLHRTYNGLPTPAPTMSPTPAPVITSDVPFTGPNQSTLASCAMTGDDMWELYKQSKDKGGAAVAVPESLCKNGTTGTGEQIMDMRSPRTLIRFRAVGGEVSFDKTDGTLGVNSTVFGGRKRDGANDTFPTAIDGAEELVIELEDARVLVNLEFGKWDVGVDSAVIVYSVETTTFSEVFVATDERAVTRVTIKRNLNSVSPDDIAFSLRSFSFQLPPLEASTTADAILLPTPFTETTEFIILMACLVGVLFIIVLVSLVCLFRRKKRKALAMPIADSEMATVGPTLPPSNGTYSEPPSAIGGDTNTSSGSVASSALRIDKRWLIKESDVVKEKKLAEGGYGAVYRAKWRHMTVAVKEVKGIDEEARSQLIKEAEKLQGLRPHPNVVVFYGLCPDPLLLLLSFCEGGSLDTRLYGENEKDRIDFSEAQLHTIVLGTAKGVAHLHEEGIIHRDLAARNILLQKDYTPCVTDFGMSREGQKEEVNTTKSDVGPLKWMAPEQMRDSAVSMAADCWSYAVILFEVYERAMPWRGITNVEAASKVLGGEHLPVPSAAPPVVKRVMLGCFDADVKERWTMEKCVAELQAEWEPNAISDAPKLEKKKSRDRAAEGKTMRKKQSARSGRNRRTSQRIKRTSRTITPTDAAAAAAEESVDHYVAPPDVNGGTLKKKKSNEYMSAASIRKPSPSDTEYAPPPSTSAGSIQSIYSSPRPVPTDDGNTSRTSTALSDVYSAPSSVKAFGGDDDNVSNASSVPIGNIYAAPVRASQDSQLPSLGSIGGHGRNKALDDVDLDKIYSSTPSFARGQGPAVVQSEYDSLPTEMQK